VTKRWISGHWARISFVLIVPPITPVSAGDPGIERRWSGPLWPPDAIRGRGRRDGGT
jgi:hypothetical protein